MSPFDVLLVPVDQSEQSDRAVGAARDLAQLTGGVVHLLHIREREVVHGKLGGSFELETAEEAESLLAKEVAVLRAAHVKVTPRVRRGRQEETARAIVDEAERLGADAIVMGCRGLSAFGAMVVGSTTYKVLHATRRPVLVVP